MIQNKKKICLRLQTVVISGKKGERVKMPENTKETFMVLSFLFVLTL